MSNISNFRNTICITGLRPQKLSANFGLNYNGDAWKKCIIEFKKIIVNNHATKAISGMAMGGDLAFAIAVLQLKKEGYNIKLSCYLPFKGQEKDWDSYSKFMYNEVLKRADEVIYISEKFHSSSYFVRNKEMVKHSNIILGFWDGKTPGGTKMTLDYAKTQLKPIIIFNPYLIQ